MSEVQHSTRAHALLSASGASRWLNCTPSPRLEDRFKEPPSSDFAEEGTLAHEFADIGLRLSDNQITKGQYDEIYSELSDSKFYSPEMDSEVQKYIDFVYEEYMVSKKKTASAILSVEDKLDLSTYVPEGFGTNDAIVIGDGVLKVFDLKYGKGLRVDADDNPQLKLYALGALEMYDFLYDIETVQLNIVQPRLNHYSVWEISKNDLLEWGQKTVKPKAKKAFEGKGVQKAGDWCRWCKAKATCATLASVNMKIAQHDFKDPHLLTPDQVLEVYQKIPLLSLWANAVNSYVLKKAKEGHKWPGYKLVEGRSNRQWRDTEAVQSVLKDELYEEDKYLNTKLKGIGDIEKLVKKTNFPTLLGHLVIKPQGAPTLVSDDDKRPEIGLESAKKDFE